VVPVTAVTVVVDCALEPASVVVGDGAVVVLAPAAAGSVSVEPSVVVGVAVAGGGTESGGVVVEDAEAGVVVEDAESDVVVVAMTGDALALVGGALTMPVATLLLG
jgi:hypothetical protein